MANTKLENLEKQLANLASRNYGERAENAKMEAVKAQESAEEAKTDVQIVSDEVIGNAGILADFLEEYYLSQFE